METGAPVNTMANVMAIAIKCPICMSDGGAVIWRSERMRVIQVDDSAFPGYCRIIWNMHIKEMTDLDERDRQDMFTVMLIVEQAIRDTLNPDKINVASFGNQVPHLHWHIIPRWNWDTHFPDSIWGKERREADVDQVSRVRGELLLMRAAIDDRLGKAFP